MHMRLSVVIVVVLLLLRFHTGLVRYFDPDEFAHMHWAWLMARGFVPYRDFFFFTTTFYQWMIMAVFWLGDNWWSVYVIRVWQFLAYCATTYLVYRISSHMSGRREVGVLAAVMFAAFPMTFDKTIDIRPDITMMVGFLLAVDLLMPIRTRSLWRYAAAGWFVSMGVLILPKILFGLPAIVLLLVYSRPTSVWKALVFFIGGALVPAFLFVLYLVFTKSLAVAFTAMTSHSVLANYGKVPFSPWKALSPYPIVYVTEGGMSIPWVVNTALWILALIGLPLFIGKNSRLGVFLLLFFTGGLVFIFLFPVPYVQYFIPISVFASFLSAYAIYFWLDRRKNTFALLGVVACLVASFFIQYRLRVTASANNVEQIQVLKDIQDHTDPNARFYDMVGSYVFRPDGYFFCCHPYAEFIDKLGSSYPTLRDSLVSSQTKYIVLDRTGMAFWKPKRDDLLFIETHYLESPYRKIYTPGFSFACDGGACTQTNVHGRATNNANRVLDVVIPGEYKIVIKGGALELQGRNITTDTVYLEAGRYDFSVSPQTTAITIQMVI